MTPEYFDQSPARKSHAVRRAAPTVSKYVEQIDEANAWLAKYMSQRPILKNRLETLEQKRVEVTRGALTTFASQIQEMGKSLSQAAEDIVQGVNNIDDVACKRAFINDCRVMPTPHLESPAMFVYTLPVPISELGIRAVRDPRVRTLPVPADAELFSSMPSASSTPRPRVLTEGEDGNIGKRFSMFANRMFGNQNETPRTRRVSETTEDQIVVVEEMAELLDDVNGPLESGMSDREQVTRFGNIRIQPTEDHLKVANRPVMKTARRASAVANADDMDSSFMTQSAPTA